MANTSDHHFNPDVASRFDIESAILIHNIQFWIRKNVANKTHFHEGHTWTYNTLSAWSELFPYMKPDRIKNALLNMVKQGVLLRSEFNESSWDHTSWYAFSEESEWLEKAPPIDKSQGSDRLEPGLRSSINIHIERADSAGPSLGFLESLGEKFFKNEVWAWDQNITHALSDADWPLKGNQRKAALFQYLNWKHDLNEIEGVQRRELIRALFQWCRSQVQADKLKNRNFVEENADEYDRVINWHKRNNHIQ